MALIPEKKHILLVLATPRWKKKAVSCYDTAVYMQKTSIGVLRVRRQPLNNRFLQMTEGILVGVRRNSSQVLRSSFVSVHTYSWVWKLYKHCGIHNKNPPKIQYSKLHSNAQLSELNTAQKAGFPVMLHKHVK